MKITVYELLGLIKDGKAPNKIKYNENIYYYDKSFMNYSCDLDDGDTLYLLEDTIEYLVMQFNYEVEIIEEEKETKPFTKKDIEALGYACGEIQKCFTNGWTKSLENKPLEEEKKIPEKLEIYKDRNNNIFLNDLCYKYMPIHKDSLSFNEQVIVDKLNEVLDYLKSKGE